MDFADQLGIMIINECPGVDVEWENDFATVLGLFWEEICEKRHSEVAEDRA